MYAIASFKIKHTFSGILPFLTFVDVYLHTIEHKIISQTVHLCVT